MTTATTSIVVDTMAAIVPPITNINITNEQIVVSNPKPMPDKMLIFNTKYPMMILNWSIHPVDKVVDLVVVVGMQVVGEDLVLRRRGISRID